MSKDRVSLTYKNNKLRVMVGDKDIPLDSILELIEIDITPEHPPSMRIKLVLDRLIIDDMEAIAEVVRIK